MKKQMTNCQNCHAPLLASSSEDNLYYWCFLVKDPQKKQGLSEIRLGSLIGDIDQMLAEFKKEMPNLEVIRYTSIAKKFFNDQRQIFVIIDGQLRLNPQMLPLR